MKIEQIEVSEGFPEQPDEKISLNGWQIWNPDRYGWTHNLVARPLPSELTDLCNVWKQKVHPSLQKGSVVQITVRENGPFPHNADQVVDILGILAFYEGVNLSFAVSDVHSTSESIYGYYDNAYSRLFLKTQVPQT